MVEYPQKRREFRNHHFDSTIWNDFQFRNDATEPLEIVAERLIPAVANLEPKTATPR